MVNPLASVIIPVYNQGRYIAEAIESVWRQDFPQEAIEIIVVDDGSVDDTREIVGRFQVSGSRCQVKTEAWNLEPKTWNLRYIYQSNKGKAMAMKAGIEAAQGKYIFNLDADDVFLPGKIKKVVDVLEADSEITYVAHPVIYWDEQKNTKRLEQFPKLLKGKVPGKDILHYFYTINKFYGCGSTFAARSNVLKNISIKKEIGPFVDGYLVLFSANAGSAYFMDEPFSLYRIHPEQHSIQKGLNRLMQDVMANEAILQEMQQENFEEKVKMLHALKIKVSQLKTKEVMGDKKLSDVTALWSFIFKNKKKFGVGFPELIISYKLIQRSVRGWLCSRLGFRSRLSGVRHNMSNPLISVIIPSYNHGRFIIEAIESVWRQDYPQDQIEIIVVDDGSTDGTREIVERLAVCPERLGVSELERKPQIEGYGSTGSPPLELSRATWRDKPKTNNLIYIYQQNSGQAWAVKQGIDAASGKYGFILNADDIFLPEKISKIVNIFENDEEITHISHPAIYWYMDKAVKKKEIVPKKIIGRKINGRKLLSIFYQSNKMFGGGSTYAGKLSIWKNSLIKKEIDMKLDEFLVLVGLDAGFGFFMNEPLSIYRIHSLNYSHYNIDSLGRNLKSYENVLLEYVNKEFNEEIRVLFGLRYKIMLLKFKELHGNKSVPDIFDIWSYIIKNRGVFGTNLFRIIKNFRVLQRSCPMPIVNLFFRLKESYNLL